MKIDDKVIVDINENPLDPQWKKGTIQSIYITYDKTFYLIELEDGTKKTVEGKYVKEA